MPIDEIYGRNLFALPEVTLSPHGSGTGTAYENPPQLPRPPKLVLPDNLAAPVNRNPIQDVLSNIPSDFFDELSDILASDKATPAFYNLVINTLSRAIDMFNAYKANQIKAQQAAIAPLVNMYKNLVAEQHNLANVISQATNPEIVKYMLPKWAELENIKRGLLSRFPMLQALPMDEETGANNLQTQKMEILSQLNKR